MQLLFFFIELLEDVIARSVPLRHEEICYLPLTDRVCVCVCQDSSTRKRYALQNAKAANLGFSTINYYSLLPRSFFFLYFIKILSRFLFF